MFPLEAESEAKRNHTLLPSEEASLTGSPALSLFVSLNPSALRFCLCKFSLLQSFNPSPFSMIRRDGHAARRASDVFLILFSSFYFRICISFSTFSVLPHDAFFFVSTVPNLGL